MYILSIARHASFVSLCDDVTSFERGELPYHELFARHEAAVAAVCADTASTRDEVHAMLDDAMSCIAPV